jgi:DNA polymerase-4
LFDTNDYDTINEAIIEHAKDVWKQLQSLKLKAKTITLSIKNPNFVVTSKSKSVPNFIKNYEELIFILKQIYDANFIDKTIRLVGVGISKLS